MLRFRLGLADLAATSFAYSPLQEAVLSLRMWTHPGVYVWQTPGFERVRPSFELLDCGPLLRSLIASNRWVPDFLTPRPPTPAPDFRSEIAVLRTTTAGSAGQLLAELRVEATGSGLRSSGTGRIPERNRRSRALLPSTVREMSGDTPDGTATTALDNGLK